MKKIALNLLNQAKANDYRGYDPFDALNSRLFQWLQLGRSGWLRLAWLQFHKRSPINFRRLCLIPKVRNPKAIALMMFGLMNLAEKLQEPSYFDEAKRLGDWLLKNPCQGWKGMSWGYPFPWQARAFYVPKGKPNLIATAYVARALRRLGEVAQIQDYIEAANQAGEFVITYLYNEGNQPYFSYIPGEAALVHNANLWAAVIVLAAAKSLNQMKWEAKALLAIDTTLKAQQINGAWQYGNRAHHQFIDGFHSGYNLEALFEAQILLGDTRYQRTIDKGLAFYVKHCFTEKGEPKYYSNKLSPIDTHSAAQGLLTLEKLRGHEELKQKLFNFALDKLYSAKTKRFIYQITPCYTNRINYFRWVQAWMFYALTSIMP